MTKVTFIDHTGKHYDVEAAPGSNLMQAAVDNNVPGIDGDCGGMCACATCHVMIDKEWLSKTGSRSENEESMLSFLPEIDDRARLGCQVQLSDDLDGIVVHLPIEQF